MKSGNSKFHGFMKRFKKLTKDNEAINYVCIFGV